jgi:hypothetical protein
MQLPQERVEWRAIVVAMLNLRVLLSESSGIRGMIPGAMRWILHQCPDHLPALQTTFPQSPLSVCVFCPQPCPPGSMDFRRLQCETFNGKKFMGRNYLWEPFLDGKLSKALPCFIHKEILWFTSSVCALSYSAVLIPRNIPYLRSLSSEPGKTQE